MSEGLIYVLYNPAMPDRVKIGKTTRTSEERARELFSTGVPLPFQVVYEAHFHDVDRAEEEIHRSLAIKGVRGLNNREFFNLPIKDAVKAVVELQFAWMEKPSPNTRKHPQVASKPGPSTPINTTPVEPPVARDIQALEDNLHPMTPAAEVDEMLRKVEGWVMAPDRPFVLRLPVDRAVLSAAGKFCARLIALPAEATASLKGRASTILGAIQHTTPGVATGNYNDHFLDAIDFGVEGVVDHLFSITLNEEVRIKLTAKKQGHPGPLRTLTLQDLGLPELRNAPSLTPGPANPTERYRSTSPLPEDATAAFLKFTMLHQPNKFASMAGRGPLKGTEFVELLADVIAIGAAGRYQPTVRQPLLVFIKEHQRDLLAFSHSANDPSSLLLPLQRMVNFQHNLQVLLGWIEG